jgi:hypothetical protein
VSRLTVITPDDEVVLFPGDAIVSVEHGELWIFERPVHGDTGMTLAGFARGEWRRWVRDLREDES